MKEISDAVQLSGCGLFHEALPLPIAYRRL